MCITYIQLYYVLLTGGAGACGLDGTLGDAFAAGCKIHQHISTQQSHKLKVSTEN